MATPESSSKTPELVELGGTGLRHDAGQINEEIIKQLQWPRCIKIYKEMETDALISGALFAIRQFIRSSKWTVKEYDGPNKPSTAKQDRQFVEECLNDLDKPWEEVLTDILSFLTYGFSVHEIVYKKRSGLSTKDKRFRSLYSDGKFGWRKFPIRSQDTIEDWDITRQGDLERIHQQDHWNNIDVWIPEERFLLFRTTAYKDSPMGQSILRSAYRAYHNRVNIEIFEGIGFERNLAGVPIAKLPAEYMSSDASPGQKMIFNQMKTTVANIKLNQQSGVVIPSNTYNSEGSGAEQFSFELLKMSGTGNHDTNTAIERYDRRIMYSMLTDFLLMGGQSVGSYSLASSKVMAFTTAITSYLDIIANQFNTKAIPLLFQANGMDSSKTPKLVHDGVDQLDIEAVGSFLKDVSAGGFITPSDDIENRLREDYLKVPPKEVNESMMERMRRQEGGVNNNQEPPINLIPET